MESKIIGKIHPHKLDPDLYVSEPMAIPYFDYVKVIVGIYEAGHEPTLKAADRVLENFMKLNLENRAHDTKSILEYYKVCLNDGMSKPLKIESDADIWKYVYPNEIIVNSLMGEGFFVDVSCECDWEIEHGLQLIFKNGRELIRARGHE